MAAQSDGYSPRCSCTIRTARSRTSGENLFDFFMAQSSQRFEPPQNTGRFRLQIASAFENIFFSGLDADIPRLLKLFGKWRSADKVKANIWKNGSDDSGRVIAMQLQGNLARPTLSFVRIRAKAKKFRTQFQRQRYQPAVVKRPSLQAREEGSVL